MRPWPFPVAALVLASACTHGEPPTWDAASGSLAIATMTTASNAAPTDASAGAPVPTSDASTIDQALKIRRADAGADPATLPQTHDRPSPSGEAFDARVHALWDAIANDDPERALPFFFPLAAYEQVKAIANPASDWKRRLVAAYTRDIHALHARLGAGAARARFVRIDVPMERARWVDPGEEYNKLGYFRVFGSKIYYAVDPPAGDSAPPRSGSIDVTSLISWRGEWFCVHLSSIR